MNDLTLDTPWSGATPALTPSVPMTGVDVLPAYPPDATASSMETLAAPWSAQPPRISAGASIKSLQGIAMVA